MHRIFTLYLKKLLGSKYDIPEVYAQKFWHITDGALIKFLKLIYKTKGDLKLCRKNMNLAIN